MPVLGTYELLCMAHSHSSGLLIGRRQERREMNCFLLYLRCARRKRSGGPRGSFPHIWLAKHAIPAILLSPRFESHLAYLGLEKAMVASIYPAGVSAIFGRFDRVAESHAPARREGSTEVYSARTSGFRHYRQ